MRPLRGQSRPPERLPRARDGGADHLGWCHGPDRRGQHGLDARHQCCQACRKVTRAHKMVMVKENSPGKGESTRSSESTQTLPATCPSIVGVSARLVSKVQAYHFITCYCRREDCPRGAIPDHAGHRSARALAVRPLRASRVRYGHARLMAQGLPPSGGVGARPRVRKSQPDCSSDVGVCSHLTTTPV